MPKTCVAPVALLLLLLPCVSFGGTTLAGLISFDVLIPPDIGPGVNVFQVSNFTGDPGTGGLALPPDFPIFTSLTFLNASLTLDDGLTTTVVPLGDLGPGISGPVALQFPDTASFVSAIFMATLSQTSLNLADSSTFFVSSPTVSARLLPSAGLVLQAGLDLALIEVSDQTAIPEPAPFVLMAAGFGTLLLGAHRRRSK